MNARVFAMAVKYQVPALASLAVAKFKHALELNSTAIVFARAIEIAFTSTPENVGELRDIVLDTLINHKALLQDPDIKRSIRSIKGLACDLLEKS